MNEPQETNYFIITPIARGYRKPVNKEIVFMTPYQKVVETIVDDEEDMPIEDIKIIIKQDEVLSANIFYSELYDRFQSYKKNRSLT